MWGELHEEKCFQLQLPRLFSAGEGNRLFRELGATLHYDVYSFAAQEYEIWQAESLLEVDLFRSGGSVDAQDDFDSLQLSYPFASRPASDQVAALIKVEEIAKKFGANITYEGREYDRAPIQLNWDACNDFLMKEWGEEPGSSELRRMIEENHA